MSPATSLNKVDFPAPLAPRTTSGTPDRQIKESRAKTARSPRIQDTFFAISVKFCAVSEMAVFAFHGYSFILTPVSIQHAAS